MLAEGFEKNAEASDTLSAFISRRNIRQEDLPIIASLAGISPNLIVEEFHNLFNTNKDRSGEALTARIAQLPAGAPARHACISFLEMFSRYGWGASYDLVRTLEGEGA